MEIKHAKGKPKNEHQVKGPDHKENHAGPSLKDGGDPLKGMSTTGTDTPNVVSDSTNLAVDMIEVLASANQDRLKEVMDSALGLTSLITGVDSVQESGTIEEGIVPVIVWRMSSWRVAGKTSSWLMLCQPVTGGMIPVRLLWWGRLSLRQCLGSSSKTTYLNVTAQIMAFKFYYFSVVIMQPMLLLCYTCAYSLVYIIQKKTEYINWGGGQSYNKDHIRVKMKDFVLGMSSYIHCTFTSTVCVCVCVCVCVFVDNVGSSNP